LCIALPITTEPAPNEQPVDTARIAFSGIIGAGSWSNVMWLRVGLTGSVTEAAVVNLANDLFDAYVDHLLVHIPGGTELDLCKVNLRTSGGFIEAFSTREAAGGGGSGSNAPAQVAPVIDWHISSHYRGGHPRSYLPGIAVDAVAQLDQVESALRATLASGALAYLEAVNGDTTAPFTTREVGTVRFFSAGTALAPPLFFPYTGAHCRQRLGTQRRRIGGR